MPHSPNMPMRISMGLIASGTAFFGMRGDMPMQNQERVAATSVGEPVLLQDTLPVSPRLHTIGGTCILGAQTETTADDCQVEPVSGLPSLNGDIAKFFQKDLHAPKEPVQPKMKPSYKKPPATKPQQPAPVQAQSVAPPPSEDGACQYDELMRRVFVEDPEWAVRKMHAESGCNPNIVNPKTCTKNTTLHAKGLMQLCGHADLLQQVCPGRDPNESVFDPNCNVQAAHKLYQGKGRQPWGG